MPQDTVPQFQSSGVFRKRHKYDINLPQPGRLFSTEKKWGDSSPLLKRLSF